MQQLNITISYVRVLNPLTINIFNFKYYKTGVCVRLMTLGKWSKQSRKTSPLIDIIEWWSGHFHSQGYCRSNVVNRLYPRLGIQVKSQSFQTVTYWLLASCFLLQSVQKWMILSFIHTHYIHVNSLILQMSRSCVLYLDAGFAEALVTSQQPGRYQIQVASLSQNKLLLKY